MNKHRRPSWPRRAALAAIVAALAITTAGNADAARRQPDWTSLDSMARYYHCDIVATPGPDWFHGNKIRGWIIGVEGKGYFHAHPSFWGWEPRGHDWIKAVCQF